MKISFIGSGGVACSTAFAVGLKGLASEIVMLDINKNFAKGKAIDLQQGFVLDGKDVSVIGTDDYVNIKGSDIIVITAGVANRGNADREALLAKNKLIMMDIANKIKDVVPTNDKQPLIIMVTNPLDVILQHFIKVGNFNIKKTIGSGNWLDSARFKYYLARELKLKESAIETFTVGQHGQKMVYLLSQTKVNSKPLFEYIKDKNISLSKVKEISEQATNGGAEIISLIVEGGTFYGPAISIFELIDSYLNDKNNLLTASIYCQGEYGINNYCVGCPVVLGKNGVKEIKVFDITDNEKNELMEAANFINELNAK